MMILCIVIILVVVYKIILAINNTMIFKPVKLKGTPLTSSDNLQTNFIISLDDCDIHCNLIRNNTNNLLFLFSHGNSGNISNKHMSSSVQFLLKYGSVILFDYRGYGYSSGTPSESGLCNDILAVWNYSTSKLKYKPRNIVLYGESLGCSCVSWLGSHLLKLNRELPYGIIMQSGFYSLRRLATDLLNKYISYLLVYGFNNYEYVASIKSNNKKYPILVLHSKSDELINYNHSKDLAHEHGCILHEISGPHNNPKFDDITAKTMDEFLKDLEK